MLDHIFTGATAIVAILAFLNTVYIQQRQAANAKNSTALHGDTMNVLSDTQAALADNTKITKETVQRLNGRLDELLAITAANAKIEGIAQERRDQVMRSLEVVNATVIARSASEAAETAAAAERAATDVEIKAINDATQMAIDYARSKSSIKSLAGETS